MLKIIKANCGEIKKYLVYVPIIECYLEFNNLKDAKYIYRNTKRWL